MSSAEVYMEQNMTKPHTFTRESIISLKDPIALWSDHWFALALELSCAAIFFQIFRQTRKRSPHLAYQLLTAASATFCFEILPVVPVPGYQLWWYHQGFVNVLKQRVPSYVITFFALVYFMAHSLTNKSNLPYFTRSVVTAITAVLIMFPSLWLAPRLLLVFFHFDDPVFRDRFSGIPYIHVLVVFLLFFHVSHLFYQNFMAIEPHDKNTFSFVKCALVTGLVSALYTIVEQYLLNILFHLTMRFNSAVCVLAAIAILMRIASKELKELKFSSYSIESTFSPLLRKEWLFVAALMLFTSSIPLWLNIRDLKSSGTRLELGPCGVTHEVGNTSPLEIVRRKYVCPDDLNRLDFDFHCISRKEFLQGVKNKTNNYTICGKNFENPVQTFQDLFAYSAVCLILFYAISLFSFTFQIQQQKLEDSCKKVD